MNLNSKASKYFLWKELLYLPSWNTYHNPSQQQEENLLLLASKMDSIRDFLNHSINVHVAIRPILNNPKDIHHGMDYNLIVNGAKNSAHKIGLAMDFDAGESCDITRQKILDAGLLDSLDMYMEDKPGSNWVHLNCNDGISRSKRFFIP